ncbi:MAG: hypothetical protein ACI89U_001833, partial [Gammaproteobacteria bacterium]
MRCALSIVLFLSVFLVCAEPCYADLKVQFRADGSSINLAPHLSYLKTSESLSVDEVLKKEFVSNSSNRLDFGFVSSNLWLRIPYTVS